MLIGVPREIKPYEYRLGMIPSSVREAVHHGHQVLVQRGMGEPIGFEDDAYAAAGAEIVDDAGDVFSRADMIVKVKEPLAPETAMLREGQVLFTYLHLAPNPEEARLLRESGVIAIAYETVTDDHGGLPLLAPMSAVAGRMAVHVGAHCLEMRQGGRGMLLGGVFGVPAAHVVVLGGGTVGSNAARMAMGLGARTTVIDKSLHRLAELDLLWGSKINTVHATVDAIEHYALDADLVVGAVLVPGAAAPKLVTRDMVKTMKRGAVIVDVAIDQGGCCETSRPTTHAEPTFIVDEVVHYCVTNMPGGVSRTATEALNNATLPFIIMLANKGPKRALAEDVHLRNGLNIYQGSVTHEAVAHDLGETYVPALEALAA